MSENKITTRKPDLNLTILKAYLESLRKEADLFQGYSGMKLSLERFAAELNESDITDERTKEILSELMLYGRTLRERLEREARERDKEKYDSPFDKIGKTFTGELEI